MGEFGLQIGVPRTVYPRNGGGMQRLQDLRADLVAAGAGAGSQRGEQGVRFGPERIAHEAERALDNTSRKRPPSAMDRPGRVVRPVIEQKRHTVGHQHAHKQAGFCSQEAVSFRGEPATVNHADRGAVHLFHERGRGFRDSEAVVQEQAVPADRHGVVTGGPAQVQGCERPRGKPAGPPGESRGYPLGRKQRRRGQVNARHRPGPGFPACGNRAVRHG
jgi:hypothetical protein